MAQWRVALIDDKDEKWASDKSQSHCSVCATVKLSKGKRHHCRLCGNLSCKECCPRICKKCLSENISASENPTDQSNDTLSKIVNLFQKEGGAIRWKQIKMFEKIYYEPVYLINKESNICIVRDMIGDYWCCDDSLLFRAPSEQNIMDSLQCLVHGYIHRCEESSVSMKKALYSLQDNNDRSNFSQSFKDKKMKNNKSNKNEILTKNHIFSFYPMLTSKDCYKIQGLIFKDSLTKMKMGDVHVFHYVHSNDSPKHIPAYVNPSTNSIDERKVMDSNTNTPMKMNRSFTTTTAATNASTAAARRRQSSTSLTNLKQTMTKAQLEGELETFKKGYQDMRKMYEDYVKQNEKKTREMKSITTQKDSVINRLQSEVDSMTQLNSQYKKAVDINANQVNALKEQLKKSRMEFDEKLRSQGISKKQTQNNAESQVIDSLKTVQDANVQIASLQKEIQVLRNVKNASGAVEQKYKDFRFDKEKKRADQLEIELQNAMQDIADLNDSNNNESDSKNNEPKYDFNNEIGKEFNELFMDDHNALFEQLFQLLSSYKNLWNPEYFNFLIYELFFNLLQKTYVEVRKYEKNVSASLCEAFSINKQVLYESFYNFWTQTGKYKIFLHSMNDRIDNIQNSVLNQVFFENFLKKNLNLDSNQIEESILIKINEFTQKCVNIAWKMCTKYPVLSLVPNAFMVNELNKVKYHEQLHEICRSIEDENEFILYYIWPVISHNNFHSIHDNIKIRVCLGNAHVEKTQSSVNKHRGSVAHDQDDGDSDSVGMQIFDHDDDTNYYDQY